MPLLNQPARYAALPIKFYRRRQVGENALAGEIHMAFIVATNTTTAVANGVNAVGGDFVLVPFGVSVIANGATFSGILNPGGGSVEIGGTVAGYVNGVQIGNNTGVTMGVIIDSLASVSAYTGAAVSITAPNVTNVGGGFTLTNNGTVNGANGNAVGLSITGRGNIANTGSISGNGLGAIVYTDTNANDSFFLYNEGLISGGYNGSSSSVTETFINRGIVRGNVTFGTGANDYMVIGGSGSVTGGTVTFNGSGGTFVNFSGVGSVVMNGTGSHGENYGTINGNLTFGAGASGSYFGNAGLINGTVSLGGATMFDSSLGRIFNAGTTSTITTGSGGAIVTGAINGGSLLGGSGNDILMANQTQMSADDAAGTILDGGAGTNALYGGSANNMFQSGNATANQIWGGASKMSGSVGSYINNLVSYAGDGGKGVYVDLLNGHNAFVRTTAGDWGAGSFALEDSIAATPDGQFSSVPNVWGSTARDIIICDNGVDKIAGLGGSDFLYAGTGASSRDTFQYMAYSDSNLVTGYDSIVGFKEGIDKIDISAMHLNVNNILIQATGASSANVYIEQTPGTFGVHPV